MFQYCEIPNHVTRLDGYSVAPLRIDMTGKVKPA